MGVMKYRGEAVSDPVTQTQGANQKQFGDCPETTLETRLQLRPLFLVCILHSILYPSFFAAYRSRADTVAVENMVDTEGEKG